MDIPWYGWIAIIGVVAWAAIPIIGALTYGRRKRGAAGSDDLVQQNTAAYKAVLSQLESIDTRLGVIEKTLTDIH
jgi:hypothetical protein